MQVSVRSHLTAGMAAVIGVGAIALAPVGPGSVLNTAAAPAPVVAEIALSGFTLPFTDILGLLQTLGIGGAIPDITGLVPADFVNAVATEFLNQAAPLVTGAASDVFGYLNATLGGLLIGPDSIPARFGAALGDIPTVLATAVQALSTGDLPTALQSLSSGLIAPIASIGQALMDAGQAIEAYVTAQINGVTSALPAVLLTAVQTVVSSNLQDVLAAVQNAISGLLGGLIPAAASVPADARVAAAATTAAVAPVAGPLSVVTVQVSAPVVPRAAALQPDAGTLDAEAPAAADSTEAEPLASPVVADQTTAPVTPRPRSVAHRAALSESAVADEAVARPSTQTPRSRSAHSAARAAAQSGATDQ